MREQQKKARESLLALLYLNHAPASACLGLAILLPIAGLGWIVAMVWAVTAVRRQGGEAT